MFTAALFTIARTWKQSKCSSAKKLIKMYIYPMECFSAIKSNKLSPLAETWMDLESVTHSEVSQKRKTNKI